MANDCGFGRARRLVGRQGCQNICCPGSSVVHERDDNRLQLGSSTLDQGRPAEFSFARQETPAQPALPPTTEPSISPVATIVPPVEPKIVSRHWHDANATTSSVGKPKQPAPVAASKKAKPADPKVSPAAERSKPTAQLKPCKRTGPFSDFMRSLNLSPACVS